MYPYLENPAFVSLGGGLPHSSTFPILKASFELPTPPNYDGTPYVHATASGSANANGHSNGNANGLTHVNEANGHTNGYAHANGHSHGHSAKHEHSHGHGAKTPEVPGKTIMKMYKGPQAGGAHAALDLAQAQQCKVFSSCSNIHYQCYLPLSHSFYRGKRITNDSASYSNRCPTNGFPTSHGTTSPSYRTLTFSQI